VVAGPENRRPFDADATASEAVVAAVADRAGVDRTDLPPLFEAVDPDALDALFADRRPGRVAFEYAGYEVTVCGRDQLAVICEERDPSRGESG
jgi:hypothetical protein